MAISNDIDTHFRDAHFFALILPFGRQWLSVSMYCKRSKTKKRKEIAAMRSSFFMAGIFHSQFGKPFSPYAVAFSLLKVSKWIRIKRNTQNCCVLANNIQYSSLEKCSYCASFWVWFAVLFRIAFAHLHSHCKYTHTRTHTQSRTHSRTQCQRICVQLLFFFFFAYSCIHLGLPVWEHFVFLAHSFAQIFHHLISIVRNCSLSIVRYQVRCGVTKC